MPDPAWWLVHGVTFVGLVACLAFALLASRRVGARTPYGEFLLVFALGFWLLLCGFLTFRGHELVTGAMAPSGNLGDAFSLGGWFALTGAFYLFTLRFPRRGASSTLRRALVPVTVALPLGLAMVALHRFVLAPEPEASTGGVVQAAYLFIDGFAVGVLAVCLERLYRFRASALGRLYILLGVGLVMNLVADVTWNWSVARGGKPLVVDVLYASASALAMTAMTLHFVQVARAGSAADRYRDPTLRLEQRVLRDLAQQLKGLAGEYGAGIALASAGQALAAHGVPHAVSGDVVEADAPEAVWRDVLERVRDGALAGIGDGARGSLASVAAAYGDGFAFLTGGRRA